MPYFPFPPDAFVVGNLASDCGQCRAWLETQECANVTVEYSYIDRHVCIVIQCLLCTRLAGQLNWLVQNEKK